MPQTTTATPNSGLGQILFIGRGLNFQLTTDQTLTKRFQGTNYRITDIIAVRRSGAASGACVGGIYTAASKGGTAIVAATQSWLTLAANVNVTATLAAANNTTLLSANTLYLSLTTGSTGAVTADVFVFGYIID